jgi:hypothetical protein
VIRACQSESMAQGKSLRHQAFLSFLKRVSRLFASRP